MNTVSKIKEGDVVMGHNGRRWKVGEEIKSFLSFQNTCPKCKHKELEYGVIEPEDEIIIQPVICKWCLYEFEIFTIPSWYIRK